MRLTIKSIESGTHPKVVVVCVETTTGVEFLEINKDAISNHSIEVGKQLAKRDDTSLVELPAETDSGTWRIWVNDQNLKHSNLEAAE